VTTATQPSQSFVTRHRIFALGVVLAVSFPFLVALISGQSPAAVLSGEAGSAKFLQGLAIEVFILGMYAISYDLVLGITGLLSFGHAMFFAVGAYASGIMLKSFGWPLAVTVIGVLVAAVLQAILFAIVLPRVKGIAFALVTLGLASVFYIVVQSSEVSDYTGGDVGLQGIPVPDWIDTNTHRFRMYLITLALLLVAYVIYRMIVGSPTGAVLLANRENGDRALSLGFNTFWFKFFALLVASITAAVAGMMWTIQQPIITPQIASLGWTVAALLMILIGGVGTLTGALIGAAVYRLLSYYLERWFGGGAPVLIGAAYIAIVLFLPYGIVGTWRARAVGRKQGLERLRRLLLNRGGAT
jgi:branched-chain amino acid transport system permease protein